MNLFLTSSISSVAFDILPKVRKLTDKKKLIFITTAGELETYATNWMDDDRRSLAEQAGFEVSSYTLTGKSPAQIQETFQDVGAICVNGGNNYYLMQQARLSGFDKIIPKLVADGLVYIGSSAGSMIAGPNFETNVDDRGQAPEMTDFSGLHLTDVSVRPHWGSADFSELYEKEIPLLNKSHEKLVLLNDDQYLHVKDDWYQIVTVR